MGIRQKRIETRDEWENEVARGHLSWVLRKGVLGYGVPLMVAVILYLLLQQTVLFPGEPNIPWWSAVLLTAILAFSGGYIAADRAWHRNQDRFE